MGVSPAEPPDFSSAGTFQVHISLATLLAEITFVDTPSEKHEPGLNRRQSSPASRLSSNEAPKMHFHQGANPPSRDPDIASTNRRTGAQPSGLQDYDLLRALTAAQHLQVSTASASTSATLSFPGANIHIPAQPLPPVVYLVLHETSAALFDVLPSSTSSPAVAIAARSCVAACATAGGACARVREYLEAVRAEHDVTVCGVPIRIGLDALVLGGVVSDGGEVWYRRPDLDSKPCRLRVVAVRSRPFPVRFDPASAPVPGCECRRCVNDH
ncbi:hypothetical protein GGR52DRAFT_570823 [Hypoxylon sp. FL1284]|nr:hypothetical protein GGR52DRAFT_570823 [Hypoxylon sp. FL1284]